MLNYFLVYPITWAVILLLYIFDISSFNMKLDPFLVLFIILTSGISLLLGILNRKRFVFKKDITKKITLKPLLFLIISTIVEFIYIKDIPFISIGILKTSEYSSVKFAPFLHVIISALGMYYAIVYFYGAVCSKENRKKNIFGFITILIIFLLYYTRSFIVMILIAAINILLANLISRNKIKLKHLLISLVAIMILVYSYGGLGNVRQGYKWNDNSYIEQIGLYNNKYPKVVPKQFMWAYSYLTTPLANLNYNVKNTEVSVSVIGIVNELVPDTISKRVTIDSSNHSCKLIKTYFNVSTGYCNSYVNGSFLGLIVLFSFMIILGVVGIKFSNIESLSGDYMIFCSIMSLLFLFMFFDNMFSYVGVSIPFWISFSILLFKGKRLIDKNNLLRKFTHEKRK